MKTPTQIAAEVACEVPLLEQLRSVPIEWREMREVGPCAHRNVPYGHMLHRAADEIARLTAIQQATEEGVKEKIAPVQGYAAGIPWSMHLRAYDVYCKRYGAQEAMITGWCRGGFATTELDMFIPCWRDELSEVGKLNTQLRDMTDQRDAMKILLTNSEEAVERLSGELETANDELRRERSASTLVNAELSRCEDKLAARDGVIARLKGALDIANDHASSSAYYREKYMPMVEATIAETPATYANEGRARG